MSITPYLVFQGGCREAMTQYAQILAGRVTAMMSAADQPIPDLPEAKADWVMHCELSLPDGGRLFASDDIIGGTPVMQGCSISLDVPTTAGAASVFKALSEGGEVRTKFGRTFWTPGFGTLRDRWGINWMISSTEPL
ncbi:VOC family protein [Rhodobacterales bacterium HKCCE3408]|nr:VOC family protein [Rhodobacterales bacterium HKCCE3408]